jgi:ElaB/YqjD/DUF883 family membrane-anchored ribosome-binding protein
MPNSTMREALRESAAEAATAPGKSSSDATVDVRADLEALRKDVLRLTAELSEALAAKGGAAWARARSNVEGVVSDATAKGEDAVDAMRDLGESMRNSIDDSLRKRPYTTLALAVAIGLFFGATWRR